MYSPVATGKGWGWGLLWEDHRVWGAALRITRVACQRVDLCVELGEGATVVENGDGARPADAP